MKQQKIYSIIIGLVAYIIISHIFHVFFRGKTDIALIEIYNSSNLSYSYLHLKHSIEYHNIKTISNNSKYGNLFSISN